MAALESSDEQWQGLQFLLTRGSPLSHPDFEASPQVCVQVWHDFYGLNTILYKSHRH